MNSFTTIPKFKFWCQKILPLVYDDSLSYMELLCKVVDYLNKVIEDINNIPDYINEVVSDDKLKDILSELLDELREQIARANEGKNTTASFNRDVDELVWLNGKLIRMTRAILAGDRYVEDDGTPDVTGNFVYTSIEIELQRVKSSLANEVTARQQADTQLQTNIDNEALARQQADTQLQGNIDNEALARQQSDTQLQSNIDNEALARQQTDTQLQDNINNEATIRQQADYLINTRLSQLLDPLSRIIFVGDSYGVTPSTSDNFVENFKQFYDYDETSCINASEGGVGFCLSEPYTYLHALQSVSVNEHNTISDIVVVGGYNDMDRGDLTITTARATSFINYCKTEYPNANVHYIYAGVYRDTTPIATRQNIIDNVDKYLNDISLSGIKVHQRVDSVLFPFECVNPTDHVHPTTLGAERLANAVHESLTGKVYTNSFNATFSTNAVTSETSVLVYQEDFTLFSFEGMFNINSSFTNGDGVELEVGTYTSNLLSIYSDASFWVDVPCNAIFHYGSNFYSASATLRLANGKLVLRDINLVGDTGWITGVLSDVIIKCTGYLPSKLI